MENNTEIILTDFESGAISLSNNSDLNGLFNFNYNFDLLKEVLTTVIKNQINLKNRLEEKGVEQQQIMNLLKTDITQIKQSQKEKNDNFNFSKNDYDNLVKKINNLENQISKINEELDKSKYNYKIKIFLLI
jgi:predicted nuclease with TOPRIM domain